MQRVGCDCLIRLFIRYPSLRNHIAFIATLLQVEGYDDGIKDGDSGGGGGGGTPGEK